MTLVTNSRTIDLASAEQTQQLGEGLAQVLPAGTVILLKGDLGAGKTTLVQGLGRGLGISDTIVSPTFTLVNEYVEGRRPLYHLDLYRLSPAEVDALFLEQYWQGEEYPLGLTAIEWSERMSVLPCHYLEIELTQTKSGRSARLTWVGPRGEADDWIGSSIANLLRWLDECGAG